MRKQNNFSKWMMISPSLLSDNNCKRNKSYTLRNKRILEEMTHYFWLILSKNSYRSRMRSCSSWRNNFTQGNLSKYWSSNRRFIKAKRQRFMITWDKILHGRRKFCKSWMGSCLLRRRQRWCSPLTGGWRRMRRRRWIEWLMRDWGRRRGLWR